MTLKVAQLYLQLMSEKAGNVKLLSLVGKNVYERNDELKQIEAEYLIPAEKIVFVMPEYNGSFPGVLKLMMDNSDIKKCWWYKKAMLVGISDGRAGNLRGVEHMTAILHYLKVHVLYNKLLLSRIKEEMDSEGNLIKKVTAGLIDTQIEEFLKF